MLVLLGTGGGFGASREFYVGATEQYTLTLAPDAAPKLVLMVTLALLLAVWVWDRLRALQR